MMDLIIDSHVHIGDVLQFNLSFEQLESSMEYYGIKKAVVSNLEGIEYDSNLQLLPYEYQKTQEEVNKLTLNLIKNKADKFKGLYWIKPNVEGYRDEIEDFIKKNRAYFSGFKAHPFHSQLKFTDEAYIPYLECARRHNLVFVVHTAEDCYSKPEFLYEVARRYPEINFVMVHMGLGSNHVKAIKYIAELPNLYGDTSWVSPEKIIEAIRICGSDKILYGTDSPIDFENVKTRYEQGLQFLKKHLTKKELADIFYNNALKLFWQ